MLLILSDLHLSDRASDPAFQNEFCYFLRSQIAARANLAGHRVGGHYSPVEEVSVLLLGDILDLIASDQWKANDARPWQVESSRKATDSLLSIVGNIGQKNESIFQCLRNLSNQGVEVASECAADQFVGFPNKRIPVRIFYMVGEADWMLHFPGPRFDLIRTNLVHQMGLSHHASELFPHDPLESESLSKVLQEHRLVARHGEDFDPVAISGSRLTPCLSNLINIEMLIPCVNEMRDSFGLMMFPFVEKMESLLFAEPKLAIGQLAKRTVDGCIRVNSMKRKIEAFWNRSLENLMKCESLKSITSLGTIEYEQIESCLRYGSSLSDFREVDYAACAAVENQVLNRDADLVVYGHSHRQAISNIDVSSREQGLILFETGTMQPTINTFEKLPIGSQTEMQLHFFYKDGERHGRRFERATNLIESSLIQQSEVRAVAETRKEIERRFTIGERKFRIDQSSSNAANPPSKPKIRAPKFTRIRKSLSTNSTECE